MNNSPIILIDDDIEDLDLMKEAFSELDIKNEILVFKDGFEFLDYMRSTDSGAFFILCDVNMGKINGLELKKQIFFRPSVTIEMCAVYLFLHKQGFQRDHAGV